MVFLTPAGDGSNRLFVALQEGRVVVFPNQREVQSAQVFLDIRDRVDDGGNEEGLLGLAFDPHFSENGFFYVYYTGAGPKRSVISRFAVDPGDPDRADPESERVILEVPQPFGNHNGGHLLFGPDGFLYIGLGDGGSGGDPQGNGQNPATLLGSILRIDPASTEGNRNYAIPADNPFLGREGFREEIWAYGFRNPWRFSFHRETAHQDTGDLWVGDVGQNSFEEVDRVLPGRNYGWNLFEGFHCFSGSGRPCEPEGLEPPVVEYPLSGGNCAVTGGHVYRGSRVPDLRGAYIYADFCSGRIWGLRHNGQQVTEQALLLDTNLMIPSFAEDQTGELLILSFDGRIHQLR
jgi:glucose/arabinose dehydrogenase